MEKSLEREFEGPCNFRDYETKEIEFIYCTFTALIRKCLIMNWSG